jgi:hypothetical protein
LVAADTFIPVKHLRFVVSLDKKLRECALLIAVVKKTTVDTAVAQNRFFLVRTYSVMIERVNTA